MNGKLIELFDDVITNEGTWSQICKAHAVELKIDNSMLDEAGSGICGVRGCSKESNYYVDFK
ncbi:hypothetical protein CN918_29270 [Priestia megaterium]|nr:hypothetical protein CN918_29270 [Priestia megaterium]